MTHALVVDLSPQALAPNQRSAGAPDAQAIGQWLAIFQGRRPNTFRTYLKEAKRWLAFLELRHGPAKESLLKAATENDVQAFALALGRPEDKRGQGEPPFVGVALPPFLIVKYGVNGQPFMTEHQPRSMNHAVATISALYEFLQQQTGPDQPAYLQYNPTLRLARMVPRTIEKVSHHFSPRVYAEMLTTIEQTVVSDNEKRRQQARRRWLVVMLYGLWLRVGEAASLKMSSFRKSHGVWSLSVVGKGKKLRTFEVSSGVIRALTQYRLSNGLPAILSTMEDLPAILPIRPGKGRADGKPCTERSLYREVKLIAQATADRLETEGTDLPLDEQAQLIAHIREISPHWFRHSGASEAINASFPVVDASERLGHADLKTTVKMYYHADAKKKRDALNEIENARPDGGSFYL